MNVENQTVEQQEKIGMTDGYDRNELQPSCMRAFDGWVRVEDKLPEPEVSVIVYPYNYDDSEDFSITGIYLEGAWYCERGNPIGVTHWRPLLQPPVK